MVDSNDPVICAIVGALEDLKQLIAEQAPRITACLAVTHSLAATHPAPGAALEHLLDYMDSLADAMQPERIESVRANLDAVVAVLSAADRAARRARESGEPEPG